MNDNRHVTTLISWLAYLGVIVYLANILDAVAIPFAAIMMVPLIVMMNILWSSKNRPEKQSASMNRSEKRKRARIDTMIQDMSDDELYELRQRLQDRSYDEDILYDSVIGDDGEIAMR